MKSLKYFLLLSVLLLFGCSAMAVEKDDSVEVIEKTSKIKKSDDYGFCERNWNNNKKASVKDLRESTISRTDLLSVDGQKNGGISVKGEDRADILVRACVRVWGNTEADANSALKSINISTSPVVKAENTPEKGWSVSYEILVPKTTNLKLTAHNGGISIKSVTGNLEFETTNGGVSLSEVGGNVKGFTTNGGISVNLSGARFNGNGLNVETKNGGVSLRLPSNYAADVETGTVNGGLSSDFKELQAEKKGRWYRNKQISARINGGGPKIRVVTTNGGVRIKSN
ncbi:MAG: DUF4097 family beta strand repeat protein [Pyrinomonadaceae bacterium]|nr:DUF4097 family beta strand repeat protein [Pyrinomonadaceae bacterium]